MSSTIPKQRTIGRAEQHFREAFDRLRCGNPNRVPKYSKVSQNNIAREAGVDPSALRATRYPEFIAEIKKWIEDHPDEVVPDSPRLKTLAGKAANRSLRVQLAALKEQRDDALAKIVDAESYIVQLVGENSRLAAALPVRNVVPMRPAESGRKP